MVNVATRLKIHWVYQSIHFSEDTYVYQLSRVLRCYVHWIQALQDERNRNFYIRSELVVRIGIYKVVPRT
jgi:hypothetical protein